MSHTICTFKVNQGYLGVGGVTALPSNFIQAVMLLTSIFMVNFGPYWSDTALHRIENELCGTLRATRYATEMSYNVEYLWLLLNSEAFINIL